MTVDLATNLTGAQSLIWAGQQLYPATPLYNMALAYRIEGPVDTDVFATAFQRLVAGTDALRTVFVEDRGIPTRRVLDEIEPGLDVVDVSDAPDPAAEARAMAEAATIEPFDLDQKLFRSGLVKLGADDYMWWLVQHHLITDGWATAIVYRRLEELYRREIGGSTAGEPMDFPDYEFYADFERRSRLETDYQEAVEYWKGVAARPLEPLTFYGRNQSADPTTRTDRVTVTLGRERMEALARATDGGGSLVAGLSTLTVFASTLFALLARVTGRRDLAILAPAHNRPSRRFKNTAGLFIEVLPLHTSINPHETFDSLMAKVGSTIQDMLLYARPGTSAASHNRAASVLLNFVNASFGDFNGWRVTSDWLHPGHGDREHALRVQVHDFDATGDWTIHFDVRRDVFDETTEQRLIRDFFRLFDALVSDPTRSISSVDLYSDAERAAIMEFNRTDSRMPGSTVVDAFRAQVARHGGMPAVRCGESTMSYAELSDAADRLASVLRSEGTAPGRVAVCLGRSSDLVVAIMGTLAAGVACVPIDPNQPLERIRLILEDSSVGAVVADGSFPGEAFPDLNVIQLPAALVTPPTDAAPSLDDLAYVMYTSGSTGVPKGVMVGHRALANYVAFACETYGRNEPVTFPLYSSIGFDLTVTSIFVPLLSGGTIVVYPETEGSDLAVIDVFTDDQVDVVKLTPAHLAVLAPELLDTDRIRTLILGGEDLKTVLARRALDASGGRLEIFNEYGPTEATVGCMIHRFDPAEDTAGSVSVGSPIPNARVHILDEGLGGVPVGVIGEMCIGGVGLAEGYLDRPTLTAEKFVPHPQEPGGVLYRTGDLARWIAPGRMEFLGRLDDQVKVRGHRVELGEVGAALRRHPQVRDVAVQIVESVTLRSGPSASDELCVRCGLTNAHPDARLDEARVCQPCRFYEQHAAHAAAYFSTPAEFDAIFEGVVRGDGEADCLMLLSGGKDSTYALYQLVERGLTPLVFSLDNGYISEGAKANIRRAVDDLGLELVWGSTPAMNTIFADSLDQFSNVCQGCFKTIYTLGVKLAHERGLRHIVTGLSRGQIFETRLADLFRIGITDPADIDAAILEARKAYHRVDDAVRRSLDTGLFDHDTTFRDIEIVDFYRYFDVGLGEIYGFLGSRAPWVRPADTGRSTNCLINNTGIFVHKNERGYHNYALPYSWDVRLGHKTRDAALAELDDDIDVTQVRSILEALPYEMKVGPGAGSLALGSETRLVAYYAPGDVDAGELRAFLGQSLPDAMIPSYLVQLDALPLTINGKVDRGALPDPRLAVRSESDELVEPRNDVERELHEVWTTVLGVPSIGVTDDFFELGGDSIMNIQIVSRAKAAGLSFSPLDLFERRTIAGLAEVAAVIGADSPEPAAGSDGFGVPEHELEAVLRKYGQAD